MNRIELQTKREALTRMLAELDRVKPSCNTCVHFESSKRCAKFDQAVPAEFQASGCDEWEYDEVPF